jgi:putative salt-induced outer membrane protein YdiY
MPSVLEGAVEGETEVLAETAELIEPPIVYEWYEWSYWFGPAPWDVGLNFGLNGSEGENRTQSIASGAYIKRDSELWTLDSKINYNMTAANSIETQNNALLDARVDRKLDKSPWSLYILNQTLYDEFQPFDLRVSVNSGVGYKWVKTDNFNLLGRFGAGASREFGGVQDEWAAEALLGLDYEYLISEKQRMTMKVDYFPEWEDIGNYRVVSDAGWEIDLDKPKNMSLRFSVNDRYDSTPNGVAPNLVNYAVLLNWKL